MPLMTKRAGDRRGTEVDGTRSEKYCSLCYQDEKFVGPDCTLNDMRKIVDDAFVENGSGRLMRWMAQKQMLHLARWKK